MGSVMVLNIREEIGSVKALTTLLFSYFKMKRERKSGPLAKIWNMKSDVLLLLEYLLLKQQNAD